MQKLYLTKLSHLLNNISSKMEISNLSIYLSKLQAPLATTDFTMVSTATLLCSHRQGRRVTSVARAMAVLVETMTV